MWIVGLLAAIVGRVTVVLAQEELDPVRNNLSLPQVGLSVLSSLAAVVGALLKGELRAESSHKDVLLPLHAILNRESNLFTHEVEHSPGSDYFCAAGAPHAGTQLAVRSVFHSSQDTRIGITTACSTHILHWLWPLALWLETKGYPSLKGWCSKVPPEFESASACMVVEDTSGHMLNLRIFLHRMRLAWFKFNCDHVVRMVVASHPHDCSLCLEIPGLAWPAVLNFIPEESWGDIQLADHTVRLNCVRHGGHSLIAQMLMEGSMGYKDHQRLAIMFTDSEMFDKSCLPKAYCALDAVERNMMTNMAKMLVKESAIEEERNAGPMNWSCERRAVALCAEISLALILCWAAQMPPLSASLVARRLVRSHSTGAWANSTLFIAAGNQAQVVTVSGDISSFDISTSLPNWCTPSRLRCSSQSKRASCQGMLSECVTFSLLFAFDT